MSRSDVEEGIDKYKDCEQGCESVLKLEPGFLAREGDLLAFRGGVRDAGLGVTLQQVFAIGHRWRIDGVGDGRPEGGDDKQECDGWPESVRDQTQENVLEVVGIVLVEASIRRQTHSDDGHVDERKVEQGHVVHQNGPETTHHSLAAFGVPLFQSRAQGTRGLEGLGLSAEPFGQEERPDDAQREIRRHPHAVAGTTLAGVVAGGNEQGKLAQTVAHGRGEAGPNQIFELFRRGISDKWAAPDQDDRNGEERSSEQNSIQTERGVQETRESLGKGHLLDSVAPKTELEFEGSVDSTNSPSGTLLQVTAIILRNSTKLQSFMNVRRLPSLTQHQCGRSDILSQRTKRELTNVIQSLATNNIAGTSAPSNAKSVFDRFDDMYEKVQALCQGIGRGAVVEQLGGTNKGHLRVDQQVRERRAEPLLFGDLSSQQGVYDTRGKDVPYQRQEQP